MSRLYLAPATLASGFVPVRHPQFAVACEGTRDMFQLAFVLDELSNAGVPVGFSAKLTMAFRNVPSRKTVVLKRLVVILNANCMPPLSVPGRG